MTTDVRAELLKAAVAALTNRQRGSFITAVRMFVTALQRVPDAGPLEYSHKQLVAIRDLGERVVTEIDHRIEDVDDSAPTQQELARTVYAIRRTLEDINQREGHLLQGKRGRSAA